MRWMDNKDPKRQRWTPRDFDSLTQPQELRFKVDDELTLEDQIPRVVVQYVLLPALIVFVGWKLIAALARSSMFDSVGARYAFGSVLIFVGLKLLANIVQMVSARSNAAHRRNSLFFRGVQIIGRATPVLAAASLCVTAMLDHSLVRGWRFGMSAVFAALLAVLVVRLHRQGWFSGEKDVPTGQKRTEQS